jgi:hypothetical protein
MLVASVREVLEEAAKDAEGHAASPEGLQPRRYWDPGLQRAAVAVSDGGARAFERCD